MFWVRGPVEIVVSLAAVAKRSCGGIHTCVEFKIKWLLDVSSGFGPNRSNPLETSRSQIVKRGLFAYREISSLISSGSNGPGGRRYPVMSYDERWIL